MRFVVLGKGCDGHSPSAEKLKEIGAYMEELTKAGVLQVSERLHPISEGVHIKFAGSNPIVTDGPFAETKEVIGGFWILNVKSKEEAIEWLKRGPFKEGQQMELRQISSAEDFIKALAPESCDNAENLQGEAEYATSRK